MSSAGWTLPLWLLNAWGWPDDGPGFCSPFWAIFSVPSPQYALDSFYSMYPKFAGVPVVLGGCTFTAGSAVISVPSSAQMSVGGFVQSGFLPQNSVIVSIQEGSVTVSNVALSSGVGSLTFYASPPVPVVVVQAYLSLAVASLAYGVWQDMWQMAVALFVAHYCTLYLQSDAAEVAQAVQSVVYGEQPLASSSVLLTLSSAPSGGTLIALTKNGQTLSPGVDYTLSGTQISLTVPSVSSDTFYAVWMKQMVVENVSYATPAQIAAQGVANGVLLGKSVGDVSAQYQGLASLDEWGAWALTKYGQQLVTLAKTVGNFPVWIY